MTFPPQSRDTIRLAVCRGDGGGYLIKRLYISREAGQTFLVGDARITIQTVDDRKNVRLLIEAPEEIPIVRDNVKNEKPAHPTVQYPHHD